MEMPAEMPNYTDIEREQALHNYSQDYDNSGLDFLYENLRSESYPNVVILTALLGLLFLIGTIGNILVVVVFARSFVKHNSTYLILTLAVVDLTINLVNIPGVLLKEWYYPFRSDTVCRMWELIQMATIPISALILVAIAFDRYFLICKAFKGPIPLFWSKLFLCCAIIIGLVLGIPPMLAVGVHQVKNSVAPPTSENLYYIGLCEPNFILIKSDTLKNYWIFLTLLFILIIMILTTLYVFIFLKVYEQSKKWNTARNNKVKPKSRKKMDMLDDEKRQNGGLPRINFRGLNRFTRLFRQRVDENCFDSKNNVFLVTISPIENQESTTCHKEYTAIEQISPELLSDKRKHHVRSEKTKNNNNSADSKPQKQKSKRVKNGSESHRQKKAHVKTAYVLCIVTFIYIISYLPTFLITHNVITGNIFLFYFYFIHSASNPVIYSFMNVQFRNEIKRLFTRKKITI
ncbi:hypothetical protein LOTGIDRAFT_153047 [Lottia gigantea]|uniref:G-protein coupled receptors family 1 profile domain-containing protein n=1 Tax=Lottia gigantea TaxID=225164 RepID=V4AWN3_LOTGI|nr:hypothetical protein LOTGIDRAFT_153047 [Lottia gigantea]ESO97936.1 hypothetical protein LOTGIDRAFT_153047 [Lottia gigantea]